MSEHDPRQEHLAYDLNKVLSSVVGLKTLIPDDAFTASLLGTERSGNGVVIREDGLVLTIGYLVTEAETIWITDNRGRAVSGTVLGYDQETGFGLVQALGPLDLPAMELGDSSAVREGDAVVLAGHGGRRSTVKAQVIGVREFAGYWEYLIDEAIFTAPAHSNWGGSAMIGADGRLLGIGSLFIQQSQGGGQPVDGNMVVPIDLLKPIYDDLTTYGRSSRPARPWLGLYGTEVENRLVVAGLTDGGPADQADVQVGDGIAKVDGRPVASLADFLRQVWAVGPAGVSVPLTVARDGELLELTIESIARRDLLKGPKLH
ncbi:PDZ/DHR/GLGF domain protein [alpha proteobacterium BAL199]|jgi:S1-C subfamily serine protease|nr:PDZ/DHR/GLGF domain protein [alpha proteobacterium BAL199]